MADKSVGESIIRKDAWNKVSGRAVFNDDANDPAALFARLYTSTVPHAEITSLDISEALGMPGVHAIVTGKSEHTLMGTFIRDMPVLAQNTVRYCGEPIALVIADAEYQAAEALNKIRVQYKLLPAVNSPAEAIRPGAPVLHENLGQYEKINEEIYPEPGTNIVNRVKIRKGDMQKGWRESAVVVEAAYSLPQAAHVYMENRNARACILPDGSVNIFAASQAPHAAREHLAHCFGLTENQVTVETSLVGGAYGGKVNPHPEFLAFVASRAVGGKTVRLSFTREESQMSCGCKIGADIKIKLGADLSGRLKAMEVTYLIDTGAYADSAPRMTRAIAASCTGLYAVENVFCDALCVYTNHVYATSLRGFGHEISTFCIERTMEKLAAKLGMDPLFLRRFNMMQEGDTSPTGEKITRQNAGNPSACVDKLQELLNWGKGYRTDVGNNKVRAKGTALIFKTSATPTNASAGAVVTFSADGSVNLNCGAVECGPGMHTVIPQILADALKTDVTKVRMNTAVNTHSCPENWKTAASMTTFLVGRAVIAAAEDAVRQFKKIAAISMRCDESDLEHGEERIYLRQNPSQYLPFRDLALGIEYSGGNSVGGQVIGRGSYTMPHLTTLDPETGQGSPGPYWTCGAQGVEIEYDKSDCSFHLIRAVTVIDAGKVINPTTAKGQVIGAMSMGLSMATREAYRYSPDCKLQNSSLRTYKVMHYAEDPEYTVYFIETPNPNGPYGLRGIGEHGILGMGACLANALSHATGREFDSLPVTFEKIWKLTGATL